MKNKFLATFVDAKEFFELVLELRAFAKPKHLDALTSSCSWQGVNVPVVPVVPGPVCCRARRLQRQVPWSRQWCRSCSLLTVSLIFPVVAQRHIHMVLLRFPVAVHMTVDVPVVLMQVPLVQTVQDIVWRFRRCALGRRCVLAATVPAVAADSWMCLRFVHHRGLRRGSFWGPAHQVQDRGSCPQGHGPHYLGATTGVYRQRHASSHPSAPPPTTTPRHVFDGGLCSLGRSCICVWVPGVCLRWPLQ